MANRLASQSSPYLLQHKDNPVDWFPWGAEALQLAKDHDKPIFLSVGYSACHWCHVMEHESFENDSIAKILNENFISIKVDREERPDLDQIYMNAVMALRNGQGGWPLSVFLTPDQEVFFGGTYWPPAARMGMPGFDHVLRSVLDAFANRREQVNQQSKQITAWLNQPAEATDSRLDRSFLYEAVKVLHRQFDFENGGFGSAPKFPHTMDLSLLIRLAGDWPEQAPLDRDVLLNMVAIQLKKMAYGGIFDHLAGGFARYSVDEFWLVPHFEKMLYDNGLLASVYLDMHATTGEPFYAMIARKTLDYLLSDMTDEQGGIHSTEDADSEGVEGKFYVWSKAEILEILGPETGDRFCRLYNVTDAGNFEGANILNMTLSYQQFAEKEGIEKSQLRAEMRDARQQLLAIRNGRIRPGKDDKVIVSWNALAISAYAKAAVLLGESKYLDAANNAVHFIFNQMLDQNGRLLHTWRDGRAKIAAYLDDYAYLIESLMDLYEVDLDPRIIEKAMNLAETMVEHFAAENGAFYFTADDQERLIARQISFQDSSVPAGNSVAALALLRLGTLTGDTGWLNIAQKTIDTAAAHVSQSPLSSGQMLMALHASLQSCVVFVVVASTDDELVKAKEAFKRSRPNGAVFVGRDTDSHWHDSAPIFHDRPCMDGKTTLYKCTTGQCSEPIIGIDAVIAEIVSAAA